MLAMPQRTPKPRKSGLTAMIDFGPDGFGWTGPRGVEDLLECTAAYIDFAKIYALNALLLPQEVVTRIVRLYREAHIVPYSGGILFEYAWRRNELDGLARLLQRLGLAALEISENYVTLREDQRAREIERFQKAGFTVIYEFGRKNPERPMSPSELHSVVDGVAACGVEHVIVEQSEIDALAAADPGALPRVRGEPWFASVLIEADPYRFPQQHAKMLAEYGSDVNLANVAPGQVLRLEGMRRGVGRSVDYALLE